GINTGIALVGNTGSHRKFKYGPHGTTVNMASRVQGATKYLRAGILITGATQAQLDGSLATRRLCQVGVVNIVQPVPLYQLAPPEQPGWQELKAPYEAALGEFENRNFRKAVRVLGNLAVEYPEDGPTLVLLSRAVRAMVDGPDEGHPLWRLSGK